MDNRYKIFAKCWKAYYESSTNNYQYSFNTYWDAFHSIDDVREPLIGYPVFSATLSSICSSTVVCLNELQHRRFPETILMDYIMGFREKDDGVQAVINAFTDLLTIQNCSIPSISSKILQDAHRRCTIDLLYKLKRHELTFSQIKLSQIYKFFPPFLYRVAPKLVDSEGVFEEVCGSIGIRYMRRDTTTFMQKSYSQVKLGTLSFLSIMTMVDGYLISCINEIFGVDIELFQVCHSSISEIIRKNYSYFSGSLSDS